jgi:NAD(P)-dependent dehydrogenase (short-subunit alcohol dehydrogenase family)
MEPSVGLFKDRTALVTGSASGIGRAVVRKLAAAGARVIGLDIRPQIFPDFPDVTGVRCDVSRETDVANALAQLGATAARVDHLVNVAGVLTVGAPVPLHETDLDHWNALLACNLTGMLILIKQVVPRMPRQAHGSIVNVSSDQAFRARKQAAAYGVSKAGVNALTRQAALELTEYGIRVNAVAPGTVRSDFLRERVPDESRLAALYQRTDERLPFGVSEPEDVADLILFLLSDRARRITGEIVRADSGQELASITF